jgi:hypothetical protein
MASVNENSEASNDTPKPDAQSKGVTFKFGFDVDMEETGASGAEDDTEGEQAKGDTDANVSDWNEEEQTPTIRGEVEKAWSNLTKSSRTKNTKSEWIRKNVAARKLVCMEEHRKERSRAQAVARADKKKQDRVQMKRAEMQKEQEKEQPEAPAAAATVDTVRKTQVWLLVFEIARARTQDVHGSMRDERGEGGQRKCLGPRPGG